MKLTYIYGGPGTGKTHKLLELLQKELEEGTPASRIAYVSFTRKGTYQGVDLAKDMFDLTDEDCRYFKTIHSLCFRILELTPTSLFTKLEKSKLSEALGFTEEEFDVLEEQSSIARNKLKAMDALTLADARLNPTKAKDAEAVLTSVRAKSNKYDFTAMLEEAVVKASPLEVDVVFIDEAQDLTYLQWQVADKLFANAKRMYMAGDVNQSLFKWAGADVERFATTNAPDVIFLNESHRCTQAVWRYARLAHSGIRDKIPMPEKCRAEVGFALSLQNEPPYEWITQLARKGSVYCLSYTKNGVKDYAQALEVMGVPFFVNNQTHAPTRETKLQIICRQLRLFHEYLYDEEKYNTYFAWQETGTTVHKADKRRIRHIRDVFKEILDSTPPSSVYKHINNAKPKMIAYLKRKVPTLSDVMVASLINNEYYMLHPIIVSVIHRVKGGEADFAFIKTNLPRKYTKDYNTNDNVKDELLRTFYVGITRAKTGVVLWHKDGAVAGKSDNYPTIGNIKDYIGAQNDKNN